MSQPNRPPRGRFVDPDGKVLCGFCNGVVEMQTAGTEANMGRHFFKCWVCSNNKNPELRNSFFKWADDPSVAGHGTPIQQQPVPMPSTPRPSQAQRAAYSRGEPSPTQPTPSKRAREEDEDAVPPTPSKRFATQDKVVRTPSKNLTPAQRARRDAAIQQASQGEPAPPPSTQPRLVSASSATMQGYATPVASQADAHHGDDGDDSQSVVFVEREIQVESSNNSLTVDEEDNFWSSGKGASGSGRRRTSLVPSDVDSDEDETAVEEEIGKQQDRMSTQHSGGNDNGRNPMPTPPHTSQRRSRENRASLSPEMDEEEDGNMHSPSKGKGKAVSNFAGTDAVDNRPSTSRIQPPGSGGSPTIDEIREARNVYDRLLKCLDDKDRRIDGHDRELLEKDMEIESLRAKVELLTAKNSKLIARNGKLNEKVQALVQNFMADDEDDQA